MSLNKIVCANKSRDVCRDIFRTFKYYYYFCIATFAERRDGCFSERNDAALAAAYFRD